MLTIKLFALQDKPKENAKVPTYYKRNMFETVISEAEHTTVIAFTSRKFLSIYSIRILII